MRFVFPVDNITYVKGCDIVGGVKSDITIMVLGEGEFMSGEAHSRARLGLPGVQQAL